MRAISERSFSIGEAEVSFLRFDLAGHDLRAGLSAALTECDRRVGLENVVRQTFFLSDEVPSGVLSPIVERAYAWPGPPTSYLNIPPADEQAVSCEIWAFRSKAPLLRAPCVTLASTPSATWGFVGGMAAPDETPLGDGGRAMLREVAARLREAGLEFARTVRTWYYLRDILGTDEHGGRYAEFNALRNEFYRDMWPDLCRSPASTGIGMTRGQVAFEGLLIRPEGEDLGVHWIDNPLQTPPYLYEIKADRSKNPSFSRAAAVRHNGVVLTFISGTASIRQSKVVHPENAAAQTEATVENMAMLVEEEQLRGLQQARVYVKRPEDLAVVRERCRALLPDAPCAYFIADVCKPDCLVEIEAVHLYSPVAAANVPASEGAERAEVAR
jgi:enamine deaminase RidA (YjgF/YER057c/UK114 family)